MIRSSSVPILLGLLALAACADPDHAVEQRLQARLEALGQRLDAADARLADLAREQASNQRLRDDLQALDRRLGALDAKTTEALDAAARSAAQRPSAPAKGSRAAAPADAPAAGAPAVDAQERRAQLSDLMGEYRRRLSELRVQQGSGADPAERMAARRQLREWYLARRRALLMGKPLPD
jgi:hypothetical protein